MSDSSKLKVVVDLTPVLNDGTEHIYVALLDTRSIKLMFDFKNWIKISFGLKCPIELYYEEAILHDLNDIRVLSLLKTIQVRPFENVDEGKNEKEFISELNKNNEEDHDLNCIQLPVDTDSNNHAMNSDVCGIESLQVDKNDKLEEVSKQGLDEEMEISHNASFKISEEVCNDIEKAKDNFANNLCDREENKLFKLKYLNGMAENLKLGTHFQQQYYGWHAKCERNERPGSLKYNKQHSLLNDDAKFTDNDCTPVDLKKKDPVCSDMKPKDVRTSEKNICKGTKMSPVKLKRPVGHEFNDKKPLVHEDKSKSSTNVPNSGAGVSNHIPCVTQKPLTSVTTNANKESSTAEVGSGSKPMSLDEILKMLRAAVVSRSKNLPATNNDPASQNEVKKKIHSRKRKATKTKAAPMSKTLNCKENDMNHGISSKNPGLLDKNGKTDNLPQSCSTGATHPSFQLNVSKKIKRTKLIQKTENGIKSQGEKLLKGCKKLNENYAQKTGNADKAKLKTGASVTVLQANITKKKQKSKNNNKTETGIKTQDNTMLKGCEKFDTSHAQKTKITIEGKLKTGESMAVLQPNLDKKLKKRRSKANKKTQNGNKSQDNALLEGFEKLDKSPIQKTENAGKVVSKSLLQPNLAKKKKKSKAKNKIQDNTLLKCFEKLDNSCIDKIESPGQTELETVKSNSVNQYDNVRDKRNALGGGFNDCSTSITAFVRESFDPLVSEEKQRKSVNDNKENSDINKSCIDGPFTSDIILKPGTESVDNPSITERKESAKAGSPFKEGSNLLNLKNLLSNKQQDFILTDYVRDQMKDEIKANEGTVSAAVQTEDVPAAVSAEEKQGKTAMDILSFNSKDKDVNVSRFRFCVTDHVIALPNKTTDNAIVEETKDVNAFDNTKEEESSSSKEGENFEWNYFMRGNVNEVNTGLSPNKFTSDDTGALFRGVEKEQTVKDGVGSVKIVQGGLNVSGIIKNEVIALPYRSIESMKTEESKYVPVKNVSEIQGSIHETETDRFQSSHAESFGVNKILEPKNDSGSDTINLTYIIHYVKDVFVEYGIFSNLLKGCLMIVVLIIMYLDFLKLH